MAKMIKREYRHLQNCLFRVNGFVKLLNEKYAKQAATENDFIEFNLIDDIVNLVAQDLAICDQIVFDATERAKSPIKITTEPLTKANFSNEQQQQIKHCVQGARKYVGGLIKMIENDELKYTSHKEAKLIIKTYAIPKNIVLPILDEMQFCEQLPLYFDE